ncbi:MAG: DUF3617 family protein [Alphaproteobacteria bacterium]|nr:DUF3617 family protein [Alphaproteobacteria bacterium]
MRLLISCLIVGGLLAFPALAEGLRPGLYEMTTTVKAEGMPAGMGDQSMRQCLSAKDLQPDRLASSTNPEDDCKLKDQQSSGNVWTGTLVCKTSGTMKVRTVSGADGWQSEVDVSGGEMGRMSLRTISRRIGDCAK